MQVLFQCIPVMALLNTETIGTAARRVKEFNRVFRGER